MSSGDEAIEAAAQRAEKTAHRNIPQLDDLPITGDTANLREGADLNDACLALLPLIGVWRGEGEVNYPTMDEPARVAQQLTIAHDGRPFLYHEARSWLLDADGNIIRSAARETGFWRPQADDTIELVLSHSSGVIELFYGQTRGQSAWQLATDAVVRSQTAKEVTAAERLYGIMPDGSGNLGYVEERAMMGHPMTPHVSLVLERVVG
ncbi:FABP family protein [Prauserella halophila]|uniref:Peroxynitrite isomerase n=1 Tax=Prauserella halophila TaxID=185641 RepID=A0ABP4GX06_9PSEU|nr:FABP family protein [Prauserella halophila]MCP2236946.1 protein of unknown function (DUF1794) [Prauserella halophila]